MPNPYEAPEINPDPGTATATSQQMVRVSQIITVALAMGALMFLLVVVVLIKPANNGGPSIVSWFMIGFAVLLVVLHLVIPASVTRLAIDRIDGESFANLDEKGKFEKLFGLFNSQHIIGCALLEGGAFANITAYQFTGGFLGNLVAGAILIGLVLIRFPTHNSVSNWVQTRSREILARA